MVHKDHCLLVKQIECHCHTSNTSQVFQYYNRFMFSVVFPLRLRCCVAMSHPVANIRRRHISCLASCRHETPRVILVRIPGVPNVGITQHAVTLLWERMTSHTQNEAACLTRVVTFNSFTLVVGDNVIAFPKGTPLHNWYLRQMTAVLYAMFKCNVH